MAQKLSKKTTMNGLVTSVSRTPIRRVSHTGPKTAAQKTKTKTVEEMEPEAFSTHAHLERNLKKLLRDIKSGSVPTPKTLLDFAILAGFQPSDVQIEACKALDEFLNNPDSRCFLLKGHAGSGKTTLIKLIYFYVFEVMELYCGLMAPTSRAARVLERIVGAGAGTIHGTIYNLRQIVTVKDTDSATGISPVFAFPILRVAQTDKGSVFIVDESSMVSNKQNHGGFYRFGTGKLLNDLIKATSPTNPNFKSKVIFVGDPCQLAPPDGGKSVAMDEKYLDTKFNMPTAVKVLTEVKRQGKNSGILNTAEFVRTVIESGVFNGFDMDYSVGDINILDETSICGGLAKTFLKNESDGIVVAFKNETVFQLNEVVRKQIWKAASVPVRKGDRLLAYRNNPRSGVVNGEFIIVVEVEDARDPHFVPVSSKDGQAGVISKTTLHFRKLKFRAAGDKNPKNLGETLFIEEFLNRPGRELSDDEFRALYDDCVKRFLQMHPGVPIHLNPKPWVFIDFLRNDPYLNAGLLKYGYAMTCQKAQGGQWDLVGVVFENLAGIRKEPFYRWAYTAITRAAKLLDVCNPPVITSLSLLKGGASAKYVPIRKTNPSSSIKFPKPDVASHVANPAVQQMYLETLIAEELRARKIELDPIATPDGVIKYQFVSGDKNCVLVFDLTKLGFFSNIRAEKRKASGALAATDDAFAQEVIALITDLVDPAGEGVEYVENEEKDLAEETATQQT
jgi:hypothetical protein